MLSEERGRMRDLVLAQAKYFLEEFDEFYPFGSVIMKDGELRPFGVGGGEEHPEVEEVIQLIEQAFANGAKSGTYKAVSMAIDVLFPVPGKEEKVDAIQIKMDSETEGAINIYIPYRRDGREVKFLEMYAEEGTLKAFQKDDEK